MSGSYDAYLYGDTGDTASSASESIYETVNAVVECARLAWPEGSAPPLPWAVYLAMGDDGFYADDRKFARIGRWCVELYQREGSDELENALERALEDAFGPVERGHEAWIDDENCSMTPFYFTATD